MSNWISIKDRMPDFGIKVWVFDKKPNLLYGEDVHTATLLKHKHFSHQWVAGEDADTDPYDISPTHWKEIMRDEENKPEPPNA